MPFPALLPCPFCGNKRIAIHGGLRLTWGACDRCQTTGPMVPNGNAAGAWNRRATDTTLRALTAMLEETEGLVTPERRGLGLARYIALEAYEKAMGAPFKPRAEAKV